MRDRTTNQVEDLEELHLLCKHGKLYDVDIWIAQGFPLQLKNEVNVHNTYKSALGIALETGQHSLTLLLLRNGYDPNQEHTSPFDIAIRKRRKDLVDLLFEFQANPHRVSFWALFESYEQELFKRFLAAGVDLTDGHILGECLGSHTSNKPLFGFVKKHIPEYPKFQVEIDIALTEHTRYGNAKGVLLCLWAGANPYTAAPDLRFRRDNEEDLEEDEGTTSLEYAALYDNLEALKAFKPDPSKIDFDCLYRYARTDAIVEFLAEICPPRDLTNILLTQLAFFSCRRMEAFLKCGVRWEHAEPKALADIRRYLLKIEYDWTLKDILNVMKDPEVCAPEIYQELIRTPTMQKRLLDMGFIKPRVKPLTKKELRRREIESFSRFDRQKLYDEVWQEPVMKVAERYNVSGSYLARACRTLNVPTPPRGYWARVYNGQNLDKPRLPVLR